MRFTRIKAPAFGRLRELDTGPDPLPGLVVVEGRNEAGKSTFFELVATALYGFYPASREGHPYAPWDGAVAEVQGRIALESGEEHEVQRRLASSPQGSLVSGTVEEELRNRTLPFVEHVPRPVFRHVFALTLHELAALEGESWDAVQDRLLGAMGASDLRSARAVAEELEAEAGRLWRTTRRGSQEVRDLEERLKELRLRRHDAVSKESEIRETSAQLGEAREELERAREDREACRAYVERYRGLLPIREQLVRVAGLQEDAGDPELLEGLPSNPARRLHELRERVDDLAARLRELERTSTQPREVIRTFGELDRLLLEREDEVEALVAGQAGLEPIRVRVAQLDQEIRDFDRRVDTLARRLLDRGASTELRGRILELPLTPLETAVRELEEIRANLSGLSRPRRDDAGAPRGVVPLWIPLAVVALGIACLLLTPWVPGTALPMAGTVCLGAGIVLTYHLIRSRADVRAEEEARESKGRALAELMRERESEHQAALERVAELLAPVDPGPGAPEPGPDLPGQVERLQELVRDEKDRRQALAAARREILEVEELGEPLRELLPPEDRNAEVGALAHLLSRALRTAVARRDAASAARRELARLEREVELTREEEAAAAAELSALSEKLARLGEGNLEAGAAVAEERLLARSRARQILEELELAHPHLDEIRGRITEAEARGEDWAVDPDAVAHRRAREETLSGEIEEWVRKIRSLEKDLEHLRHRTTLDELDGEILEVEERVERLSIQRDRLWLLGRVIREAERQIREEHQPAILQQAGRHLSRLTGGRYDRVLLAGRDGRSFRVRGPATPTPLPIDTPLSAGTREQVYLALRLSILDQLDRAGERLPLLLDEVLVNWDPERREAGLALLSEVARERQCFFFTCHPPMADRLEELGGRRIRLERE